MAQCEYLNGVSYPVGSPFPAGDYDEIGEWYQTLTPRFSVNTQSNQLYPQSLTSLSHETRLNLINTRRSLTSLDPKYGLGMKHWHSHGRDKRNQLANGTENKKCMFANDAEITARGWRRSKSNEDVSHSDEATGPIINCYLCSTLSEHERHLVRKGEQLKPKQPARPRIKYVPPPPKLADKPDVDESENIVYIIKVKTGNLRGAGTSAKVFIKLKGEFGVTRKQALVHKNAASFSFSVGSVEKFSIKAKDVGILTHLMVKHDGMEKKHSWFLEEIEVINSATREVAYFPCHTWLSKHMHNHSNKIILKAKHRQRSVSDDRISDNVAYEIHVLTGSVPMAGTDANVFITLYGKDSSTKMLPLTSTAGGNLFEKGKEDVFLFKMKNLGPLEAIRIEHDNSGRASGWYLDKVIILCGKQQYTFPCGQWLSLDEGDGKISRVLHALGSVQRKKQETEYKIQVFTGDIRNAGTDANVFVSLTGDKGSTERIPLRKKSTNNFERGKEDTFYVVCSDIGDIKTVQIEHDNSGVGPGWFLEKVIATNLSTKQQTVFPCSQWLAKDEGDGKICRTLIPPRLKSASRSSTRKRYQVIVQTGDQSMAGTDANVFITIIGQQGQTSRLALVDRSRNCFERGQQDVFNIECEDVGEVAGIRIEHDNTGRGPGWYLEEVTLMDRDGGQTYKFMCNKWLSKDEGDGKITRILVPNKTKADRSEYSNRGTSVQRSNSDRDRSKYDEMSPRGHSLERSNSRSKSRYLDEEDGRIMKGQRTGDYIGSSLLRSGSLIDADYRRGRSVSLSRNDDDSDDGLESRNSRASNQYIKERNGNDSYKSINGYRGIDAQRSRSSHDVASDPHRTLSPRYGTYKDMNVLRDGEVQSRPTKTSNYSLLEGDRYDTKFTDKNSLTGSDIFRAKGNISPKYPDNGKQGRLTSEGGNFYEVDGSHLRRSSRYDMNDLYGLSEQPSSFRARSQLDSARYDLASRDPSNKESQGRMTPVSQRDQSIINRSPEGERSRLSRSSNYQSITNQSTTNRSPVAADRLSLSRSGGRYDSLPPPYSAADRSLLSTGGALDLRRSQDKMLRSETQSARIDDMFQASSYSRRS